MKDSERLDLLKEIGGTRVYEERRRESSKIMKETENKTKHISRFVEHLDDRLGELDEEKEELKKYQQLEKQMKSLQYAIYDKELQDVKQKLAEISGRIEDQRKVVLELGHSVSEAHEKFKDANRQLKDLNKQVRVLLREKEAVEKQRSEAIKKHTEIELDEKELRDKIKGNIKAKDDAVLQLELLDREIQSSNDELSRIRKLYDDKVRDEENLTRGIMEREKQLGILYQKRGRATQFASKAARDEWLKKEITDYEQVLSSNILQEAKLGEEIEQLKKEIRERDDYIKDRKVEATELETLISGHKQGYRQYKMERDRLHDERKHWNISSSTS